MIPLKKLSSGFPPSCLLLWVVLTSTCSDNITWLLKNINSWPSCSVTLMWEWQLEMMPNKSWNTSATSQPNHKSSQKRTRSRIFTSNYKLLCLNCTLSNNQLQFQHLLLLTYHQPRETTITLTILSVNQLTTKENLFQLPLLNQPVPSIKSEIFSIKTKQFNQESSIWRRTYSLFHKKLELNQFNH